MGCGRLRRGGVSPRQPRRKRETARRALCGTGRCLYEDGMTSKSPDMPSEDSVPDTPADASAARAATLATAMHHDALFRYVFGDPDHAGAVLQVLLPPEAARHIRWDSLQPVHASMVGDAAKQLHGDLMFKALLTDGRVAFLWLLFEHQSSIDHWMSWRMTGMTFDFLRDWRSQHPAARSLPAILPVVLHHGPRAWSAPTALIELTDLSEQARADLASHLLSLRFVLHDLRTVPDEDLDTPLLGPLPRLALGSMKHCKSKQLDGFLLAHTDDVRQLLTSEHGRRGLFFIFDYTESVHPFHDQASLIRLLAPVVGPELEQNMLTYEQLVEQKAFEKASRQVSENAFEKGIEKGIEKGRRADLLRLLTRRFGTLPEAITARIADAGGDDLDRWLDRLLDAASLDELFAV
jgi:hypothetical protein